MKPLRTLLLSITATALANTVSAECPQMLKPTFNSAAIQTLDDGTLVDTSSGLMWMRCGIGQTWENGSCAADASAAGEYSWADALAAADSASFAGHDDWRLPNVNELESLVERACFNPAINTELFPGTVNLAYWTNTPNNFNAGYAWAINFANGDHISTSGESLFAARLVRSVK